MIKTKRWDEETEPDDGTRILITRYRPRGLRKEFETWREWRRELAPSEALLAAYKGKHGVHVAWDVYARRYLREMKEQKAAIEALARRIANGETVTLLCSAQCIKESRCHRSLLKGLLEEFVEQLNGGESSKGKR
jgi:uncharacterized protein YeaO (DUF488 family)